MHEYSNVNLTSENGTTTHYMETTEFSLHDSVTSPANSLSLTIISNSESQSDLGEWLETGLTTTRAVPYPLNRTAAAVSIEVAFVVHMIFPHPTHHFAELNDMSWRRCTLKYSVKVGTCYDYLAT